MKRRTWRWVTRPCADVKCVSVWPGVKKPLGTAYCLDSYDICIVEFQSLFGFLPKPLEVLKVEFSAKVVK